MMQTSPPSPRNVKGRDSMDSLSPAAQLELLKLSLAPAETFSQQLHDHLATGCRLLGMASGIMGHAEGGRYEIMAALCPPDGRSAGEECALEDTYCAEVVRRATCVAYPDISQNEEATSLPAYLDMPFESYIGIPIWTEGRLTNTLCFGDLSPCSTGFSAHDHALIELLAISLTQLMERQGAHRRLASELSNLRIAYQEMDMLFSHCHLPMAMMDFDGHWTRLNPALAQLLGMDSSTLQQGTLEDVSHPQDMVACQRALNAMQGGEMSHFEQPHRYLGRQGQIIEVKLSLDMIDGQDGGILSQHQDISELREQQESLARMRQKVARMSPEPTGIGNATVDRLLPIALLEQQLDNEIARSARHGHPLSILMLNVDAFTDFNRQFGRAAGDRALHQVASILRNATRKSDQIIQREDGTLIALLASTDPSGGIILAERVRQATTELHDLDHPITCSVGLTCYHPTPDTLALPHRLALLERAQHALKKAKRQGRNRVRYMDLELTPTSDAAMLMGFSQQPPSTADD